MGNKNKGGKEVRKPKASKKAKGIVVPSSPALPPRPAVKEQDSK